MLKSLFLFTNRLTIWAQHLHERDLLFNTTLLQSLHTPFKYRINQSLELALSIVIVNKWLIPHSSKHSSTLFLGVTPLWSSRTVISATSIHHQSNAKWRTYNLNFDLMSKYLLDRFFDLPKPSSTWVFFFNISLPTVPWYYDSRRWLKLGL